MTPEEAILASINQRLEPAALQRAFLSHRGWRAPWPRGASTPTIMVSDAAMTPTAWLFSTEAARDAACKEYSAATVGDVAPIEHLDEVIAKLDPRVVVLRIDPSSPLSLQIHSDQLDAFRRLARGARIERAMADGDLARLLAYEHYYVPYYGVLGQGHNVIALPTDRGRLVAAFTAEDAVLAFLATGSDENRARVKFVAVSGAALFEQAGPQLAEGVIVNVAGPRTFGFDLAACRDVATAQPHG